MTNKQSPKEVDKPDSFTQDPEPIEESLRFSLEYDFQQALRKNIKQLDKELEIIDGGNERGVTFGSTSGRIDILAQDKHGTVVVIELKAGRAEHPAISQIASYMEALRSEKEAPRRIRGILIAQDFTDRALLASQSIPSLTLKRYGFKFKFVFKEVKRSKIAYFFLFKRKLVKIGSFLIFVIFVILIYFLLSTFLPLKIAMPNSFFS